MRSTPVAPPSSPPPSPTPVGAAVHAPVAAGVAEVEFDLHLLVGLGTTFSTKPVVSSRSPAKAVAVMEKGLASGAVVMAKVRVASFEGLGGRIRHLEGRGPTGFVVQPNADVGDVGKRRIGHEAHDHEAVTLAAAAGAEADAEGQGHQCRATERGSSRGAQAGWPGKPQGRRRDGCSSSTEVAR